MLRNQSSSALFSRNQVLKCKIVTAINTSTLVVVSDNIAVVVTVSLMFADSL